MIKLSYEKLISICFFGLLTACSSSTVEKKPLTEQEFVKEAIHTIITNDTAAWLRYSPDFEAQITFRYGDSAKTFSAVELKRLKKETHVPHKQNILHRFNIMHERIKKLGFSPNAEVEIVNSINHKPRGITKIGTTSFHLIVREGDKQFLINMNGCAVIGNSWRIFYEVYEVTERKFKLYDNGRLVDLAKSKEFKFQGNVRFDKNERAFFLRTEVSNPPSLFIKKGNQFMHIQSLKTLDSASFAIGTFYEASPKNTLVQEIYAGANNFDWGKKGNLGVEFKVESLKKEDYQQIKLTYDSKLIRDTTLLHWTDSSFSFSSGSATLTLQSRGLNFGQGYVGILEPLNSFVVTYASSEEYGSTTIYRRDKEVYYILYNPCDSPVSLAISPENNFLIYGCNGPYDPFISLLKIDWKENDFTFKDIGGAYPEIGENTFIREIVWINETSFAIQADYNRFFKVSFNAESHK